MGQSIYEFSHPCDHADIKELLVVNRSEDSSPYRSGFFRFKCTLTSRGRSVHLRSASYKVINCTGRLFVGITNNSNFNCYVGICEPIYLPSDVDIPLNKQTFLSRHNPDMTCEYMDESVEDFVRYKPEDLVGKSMFKFHHAADTHIVAKSYKSLYAKGQTQTDRYRFLAKHGGWIWVVTQATVLTAPNSSKPTAVVCLHFVTSEIENELEILSDIQTPRKPIVESVKPIEKKHCKGKVKAKRRNIETQKENFLPAVIPGSGISIPSPSPSTTKIFAPRTDDMDSGFLMPCDKDNMQIFSKEDEPEDLTHLAPIAGDDCVSLNVPLLDELLKSFDQSKLEYSLNGFIIDLNADELPLLVNSDIGSEALVVYNNDVDNVESITQFKSPLFLDSDPLMGSCIGEKSKLDFCDTAAVDPSRRPDQTLAHLYQSSPLLTPSSSLDCNLPNWTFPEVLTEMNKPGISTDNLPILDPTTSELIWLDTLKDSTNRIPSSSFSNSNGHLQASQVNANEKQLQDSSFTRSNIAQPANIDELDLDHKRKVFRPCIDIEKGDNTKLKMDILSILSERRMGDFPKVVTSLIFGDPEPPIKLKRTGFVHPHLKPEDRINSLCNPPGDRINVDGTAETVTECIQRTNTVQGLLARYGEYNSLESQTNQVDQFLRYRSHPPLWFLRKRNSVGRLLGLEAYPTTSLSELTRQDYEVNAPLEDSNLLQGQDLLTALDTESSNDSVALT